MEIDSGKKRWFLFRITDWIEKIETVLLTVLFAEAIIVGFLQVVCRFVFKSSLPWSEELLRFSFIWLTYFAASLGLMKGSHSSVDVLLDRLPKKVRSVFCVLIEILATVFVVVIFCCAIQLISMQVQTRQLSAAMRLPMYVPYGGILISFGFMIIQCIARLSVAIRNLVKPDADSATNLTAS